MAVFNIMWCFLLVVFTFQTTLANIDEDSNWRQTSYFLEEEVAKAILEMTALVDKELRGSISKLNDDGNAIMKHTDSEIATVIRDINTIAEQFDKNGIRMDICETEFRENLTAIKERSRDGVLVSSILSEMEQNIIEKNTHPFMSVENQIGEINEKRKNCKTAPCKVECWDTMKMMRNTLPTVIRAIGEQRLEEIHVLQDKSKAVIKMHGADIRSEVLELLTGYIRCIKQNYDYVGRLRRKLSKFD